MQLFYDSAAREGHHQLAEDEARHLLRVLRRRPGDVVQLVDGRGGWYEGPILSLDKKSCLIDLRLRARSPARAGVRLSLVVGPTKKADRFEFLLEKATEIGVDDIYPVQCRYGERSKLRYDRLQRIIESAMKQSLQSWLPQLHPISPLSEFLTNLQETPCQQRLLAHIDSAADISLPDRQLAYQLDPRQDKVILVGPEGGFHPQEVDAALLHHGFEAVALGHSRLRTETAAIYALSLANSH